MTALFYLIKKQIKNYFISLKRNPAKLAGYVFCTAFLVFIIIMSFIGRGNASQKSRSLEELGSIIMGFFLFIFMTSLLVSLERGATFFKMSDVGLLFTAPISPKKILIYGIVKQMGLSLFVSALMLYQAPALIQFYGITWGSIFVILLGYMLLLIETSICSIAVYMFVNGDSFRKKAFKIAITAITVVTGGLLVYKMLQGESFVQSAIETLSVITYIPIVGWIKGAVFGVVTQNYIQGVIFSLLSLMGIGAVIGFILKSNTDYYEDVLTATEYLNEAREAVKEGRSVLDKSSKLKGDRLKSFGLRRGRGASGIFFKQLLENRRNGINGLGILKLIEVGIALIAAFFLSRDKHTSHEEAFMMIVGFMTYMQMFTATASRWANELQFHYIYLIPQSGFKKVMFSVLEGILGAGIEGLIMFVPSGLYLGLNPVCILLAVLLRMSFEALISDLNLLSQRLFGIVANKGMMVVGYFLAIILFELPAIIGGAIAAAIISQSAGAEMGNITFFAIVIGWNTVLTLGVMLFINRLFSQMELNSRS